MAPRNGLFIKWALTLLGALSLGLSAWGGKTLVSHGERISGVEAVHGEIRLQLNRIERKLDRLSERR